jgi:hypothetical protein
MNEKKLPPTFLNNIEKELLNLGLVLFDESDKEITKIPYKNNNIENDNYKIGKWLNKNVWIKSYKFPIEEEDNINSFLNYVKTMIYLKGCEGIQTIIGFLRRKNQVNNKITLIYEDIGYRKLSEVMRELTYKDKISVLYQLSKVFSCLTERKLYELIVPFNIFINEDNTIKVMNFKDSFSFENNYRIMNFRSRMSYTPYMAPEFYDFDDESNKPLSKKYSLIWNFGLIISEIFSGICPWNNVAKHKYKIECLLIKKHRFPIPKEINDYPELKELCEKCTKLDPMERVEFNYIIEFLEKLKDF